MIYIAVLSNSTESLQNSSTIPSCSLDPMPLTQYGAFSMKALAKYQIILLGEQRHIGCEHLPRVVARIVPWQESNPRPLDHESTNLYYPLY